MRSRNPIRLKGAQKGITLVLISLILLILIGMGAFAMDLNHQVLNKARLQNAVDSAALAAAVVADDTGDVGLAETAAIQALNSFAAASGNQELVYTTENISVTFSKDKLPNSFVDAGSFSFGDDEDIYVRVAVSDVSLTQYLAFVFNVGKSVSASAVAGPSSAINYSCNITPMAVCGDPTKSGEQVWGYNPNGYDPETVKDPSTINALKVGNPSDTNMGPGNFQLLDFGQDPNATGGGAALVKDALSGKYNACATIGETVKTKPGGTVGPVAAGLNPRLNVHPPGNGNIDETVLPDIYVKQAVISKDASGAIISSDFYFKDYNDCKAGGCGGVDSDYPSNGTIERRILRVPIVDCTDEGGTSYLDLLGFGCFFLLKEVAGNSGQASDDNVYGQFLYDCPIKNGSTGVESSDTGFYRIQLYKDPLSGAS
jgi:Flp pilus assembly protein TadG